MNIRLAIFAQPYSSTFSLYGLLGQSWLEGCCSILQPFFDSPSSWRGVYLSRMRFMLFHFKGFTMVYFLCFLIEDILVIFVSILHPFGGCHGFKYFFNRVVCCFKITVETFVS